MWFKNMVQVISDSKDDMEGVASSFANKIGQVTSPDFIDTDKLQHYRDTLGGSLNAVREALKQRNDIEIQGKVKAYQKYANLIEGGFSALFDPKCEIHDRWVIASDAIKRQKGDGKLIWIEMGRAFPGQLPACFKAADFDAASFFGGVASPGT